MTKYELKVNNISKYKVCWVELTPVSGGVVTLNDQKKLGDVKPTKGGRNCRLHFADKQKAIDFLTTFSGKLDKRYKALLFTDKQFSMAKREDNFAIPYTQKQLKEVYFVG